MALLANQIWQCLDLDFLDGSEILAEQLVANEDTPDTRYLLAHVQYRKGQYDSAIMTCTHFLDHPGCVWVYAQSCLRLERASDGMKALDMARKLWDLGSDMPLPVALGRGELSPAAFHLLYARLRSLVNPDSALADYTNSARLNPYLFENVLALCSSAKAKVRTDTVFTRFEDIFQGQFPADPGPMALNPAHDQQQSETSHTTNDESSVGNRTQTHAFAPSLIPSLVPPLQTVTSTPRRLDASHRVLSTPVGSRGPLQMGAAAAVAQGFGPSPSFGGPTNSVGRSGGPVSAFYPFRSASGKSSAAPLGNQNGFGLFQTPVQLQKPSLGPTGPGRRQQNRVMSLSFRRGDQTSMSSLGRNIFASPHAADNQYARIGLEALETITEALELISQAQFSEALTELSYLAGSIYETPYVLQLRGKLHLELGNYEESVEAYNSLRLLQPDRVNGMEYMSTALWHLKRDSNLSMLGYELTRRSSRLRRHWQSWCALGNAFSVRHDTQNAIKCFQRAATINPKSDYAFTLMGYEYIANDELENATEAFSHALQVNPQLYNAWYGLGSVHFSLGQYEVAELHFVQAIRLNPNNAVLLCFLGAVLESRGKFAQGMAQFEKACRLSPSSPMPRFRKAEAMLKAGMYREALKELLEIEKIAPEDSTVHFAIARAHKGLGEGEKAVQRFTGAQQLAPKMAALVRRELESM